MSEEKELSIKEFCSNLAKVYKLLNWKWYTIGSEYEIPTEKMIMKTFKELASHKLKNGEEVGTGGLEISKIDEDGIDGDLYEICFNYSIILSKKDFEKLKK